MDVAGNDHEAITLRPGRRRRRVLLLVSAIAVVAVAGGGVLALRTSDDPDSGAGAGLDADSEPAQPSGCALVVQVFLDRGIADDTRGAVEFLIRHIPDVASYSYQDQEGSLVEAERVLADQPESLERIRRNPDILPTAFRIVPDTGEIEALTAMTGALSAQAGVYHVSWEMAGVDMPSWTSTGDSEVVVFLDQGISEDARAAVEQAIATDPGVAEYRYLDEAESLAEFERLFARSEEMLDRAREAPERIPTSFRLVPVADDPDDHESLAERLAEIPGVRRAASTTAALADTQRALDRLNCGASA